jgi:hypothetical protein
MKEIERRPNGPNQALERIAARRAFNSAICVFARIPSGSILHRLHSLSRYTPWERQMLDASSQK